MTIQSDIDDLRAKVAIRAGRRITPEIMAKAADIMADVAAASGGGAPSWASVTGKPAEFPPEPHAHPWNQVTGKPATFPPDVHPIAQVTGLQAALDAKADDTDMTAHTAAADPHTGYQRETEKGQLNGYASLDGSGIVPVAQLPASGGVPTSITVVGGMQTFMLASDDTSAAAMTNRNLTGLVFTFLANARYAVDLWVLFSPVAATTGLGMAFDTSVATTFSGVSFQHQLAVAGTLSGGDSIADAAARGLSTGMPATGTTLAIGKGFVKAAGTGGTAQLIWRPEVAAVATVQAGTVMRVQRIA